MKEDLELTARRGCAVDDQQNTEGVSCFGVAVPGDPSRSIAVGATLLSAGLTDRLCEDIVADLTELSRAVARVIKSQVHLADGQVAASARPLLDRARCSHLRPSRDPEFAVRALVRWISTVRRVSARRRVKSSQDGVAASWVRRSSTSRQTALLAVIRAITR
ncbi:hypothetical protein [Lentzea albida]|uniref:hypothetical protein n=1 Tax=Lentzea albida TaxID=65499 RepID=UPI0015A6F2E9|nr:hypothetical protein [Lentzea albida]